MRVLEKFCCGRGPDQATCEDVIFVDENFVAVIDGVTDKAGLDYGGQTGGQWAALTVADELSQLPADATLDDAEVRLTARLASEQSELHVNWDDLPPAGATLVCFSRARREVWRIGDGHYALDGMTALGVMQIDEIALAARWAYVQCLRQSGMSDDEIADDPGQRGAQPGSLVRPLVERQHHFANSPQPHPLAYAVLNGHPVPGHLRELIRVAADAREVVISSDGYPQLFPTLEQTERYLAEDLRDDPLRIGRHRGFIAVKPPLLSFDDRSFVRLAID
jgi:Protein phosphatase 2C